MLDYQLLSPEEEAEEVFPYRRVWRTLITELALFGSLVTIILLLLALDVLNDTYNPVLQLGVAIVPVLTFFWLSVRREYTVFEPRPNLVAIFVLTVILANGFAVPLNESVFSPDAWLPTQGFFNRIFGHMLTMGILTAFIHYGVVRYTVWPQNFRTRLDGIAYCMAASVAFAVVLNVRYVLIEEPILSAAAIRLLTNLYLNVIVGMLVGYFLGEMAIGSVNVLRFPVGLGIAAFIYGVFMAFRGIAIRSGLNVGATASRPIGPFFLIIGFTLFFIWLIAFLVESADERMANQEGIERIR